MPTNPKREAVPDRRQDLHYGDICELSICFNSVANLGIGVHYRINEALKDLLARAREAHPHEVIRLHKAVSSGKPALKSLEPSGASASQEKAK